MKLATAGPASVENLGESGPEGVPAGGDDQDTDRSHSPESRGSGPRGLSAKTPERTLGPHGTLPNCGGQTEMFHFPWYLSALFQALMLVHYFRKRPEGYWFFVIIFPGPLGALIYFVLEVVPDLRVKPPWLARIERGRRRQWLEQRVQEAPALENVQELGEIRAAEGEHARAVELFGRVLAQDPEAPEALYGRAKSLVELGEIERAITDLEPVARAEPNYCFYGAYLTLAECYDRAGRTEAAKAAYQDILGRTTVSRAYYGYGLLLDRLGEKETAREMMRQILAKKPALPRYLRRQERPWFRKAEAFLKEAG